MNVSNNKIQCFQTIVFTQLSSQLVCFCKQYSFSNDYFSLHYFICTTRVCFIKNLISILWCWKFGYCFPFCYTRKEQFQNFPKPCCWQNLSWREKKSVWHTTLISVNFVFANNTYTSVFWFPFGSTIHNTQLTVIWVGTGGALGIAAIAQSFVL